LRREVSWYWAQEADMSLSKYYKSSDSFQPEDLVKRIETKTNDWENSVINEHSPSQNGNFTINDSSEKRSGFEENENDAETTSSVTPDVPETGGRAPGQEIDTDNYIENALAEEKIEEAYQKGLEDGETKAEDVFGTTIRALVSSCQQIDTIRETLIVNNRKEVLDFALAIAERILRISLKEQDSTIIATIEEALRRAVKSDEFTIYIHPDDYDTVKEKSDDLITGLSGLNNIVVKKDSTIEPGGAKIESDNCTIDATIGSQYDVIREELKGQL
jgi:flagellar assembly protein FliH